VAHVLALTSSDPDVQIEVTGGINRPPYEKNDGIVALFEHARGLANEIGFELEDLKTGGGSDGNFTAALGVPTLDGLGAVGGGAHADHEFVVVDTMPSRVDLIEGIIEGILRAPL